MGTFAPLSPTAGAIAVEAVMEAAQDHEEPTASRD